MNFIKNRYILKTISFTICAFFVMAFLAREHDRIRESGRKLVCRYERSTSSWKCRFHTGFTGFTAFSFQKQGASDWSFRPEVELLPVGASPVAVKMVSDTVAGSSWIRLEFPSSDVQEWQLTIRDVGAVQPVSEEIRLNCNLYAGQIPRTYYWYGIIAAGLFFLMLGFAEHCVMQRNSGQPVRRVKRADFDYGIHYFRAVAIFFIMILHYSYLMPELKSLNNTLFSSSSYFFIFISGYLFYYLTGSFEAVWSFSRQPPYFHVRPLSGKFSVRKYYKKKVLNILLPYLLTATVIYIYVRLYSDTAQLVPAVPGTWQDYFFRIRTGAVQRSHWYIYFICKVFLISPLLLFLPKKGFIVLTAASCVLPFVFTRTESHFCYFLPMYLLGMAYARFRGKADRILFHPAVKIFISILAVILLIYLYPGREEQDGLIFAARLTSTVVLLYGTAFLSRWKLPWLSYCADISFALFFIHDFIFAYMIGPVQNFYAPVFRAIPVLELLAPLSLILAAVILVLALRTLFGIFSRRVIGS